MKSRTTEVIHLADRIKQVEEHARIHLAERQRSFEPAAPEPPAPEAPARLVPTPRRARMYVRGGAQGPGFAEVTLTHPVRDPAMPASAVTAG